MSLLSKNCKSYSAIEFHHFHQNFLLWFFYMPIMYSTYKWYLLTILPMIRMTCILFKKCISSYGHRISFFVARCSVSVFCIWSLCVSGGFSSFQEKYSHHCAGMKEEDAEESTIIGLRNLRICDQESSSEDVQTPNSSQLFPVEVVPYLFLGNAKNSADLECLYKNGIKYILNVTPNVPNTFENNSQFRYLQIPITDHWSQNLSAFFPKAIAFIGK